MWNNNFIDLKTSDGIRTPCLVIFNIGLSSLENEKQQVTRWLKPE